MQDTNDILREIRDSLAAQRSEQYIASLGCPRWVCFLIGAGVGIALVLILTNA